MDAKTAVLFAAFAAPGEVDFSAFDEPPALTVPVADTYADAYARVLAGKRVTWTGTPPGLAQGTYTLYLSGNTPVLERQEVSVVAAGKQLGSGSTPRIGAQSAGEQPTSYPGVVPFQGRTLTPARPVTRGITWTDNCPPSG